MRFRLLAPLLLAALAAACGTSNQATPSQQPQGKPPLTVVTTVSPVTSIVESIGGEKVIVIGIIPEGVNSHTFEPAPSVARTLAQADLLVVNGLFLEEPALELARASMRPGTPVLSLGDKAITREEWQFDFSFPEDAGHPNPHLWPDPLLGLKYAELVGDELSRLDPANAAYFAQKLAAFESAVRQIDAAIVAAVATVPPANRALLTYHDSWAYFAVRYGFRVIGAVQPSDFSEPSARDVANLVEQVRELKVPAIFGSEVFPSRVMEQIARESGAAFVDRLRDDDLPGAPGDPRHSYLGLILTNMEIMVPALGGDAAPFAAIPAGLVSGGASAATYPQ